MSKRLACAESRLLCLKSLRAIWVRCWSGDDGVVIMHPKSSFVKRRSQPLEEQRQGGRPGADRRGSEGNPLDPRAGVLKTADKCPGSLFHRTAGKAPEGQRTIPRPTGWCAHYQTCRQVSSAGDHLAMIANSSMPRSVARMLSDQPTERCGIRLVPAT
jgi:hypothetical protein